MCLNQIIAKHHTLHLIHFVNLQKDEFEDVLKVVDVLLILAVLVVKSKEFVEKQIGLFLHKQFGL